MELDINKNVLYDIACTTLDRIEGLEVTNLPMNVGEVLNRSPRGRLRSLKVNRDEAGVTIDVSVNVEYGKNIVSLSRGAQQAVRENIELMTGLKVKAVNVTVQGLTLPKGAQG